MHKVIAIVGMCGAGKSVASDLLEEKGFQKVYFGGVTMEKLKEEGLAVTPENEKMMREELRKKYGMGAYATILLPRILEYGKQSSVVLDGLYSWDEFVILKEALGDNMVMIAIVTDKDIRYSRLEMREVRPYTYEEAKERDIAEILNIKKGGPIVYADYYILNNGDLDSYARRLDEILKKVWEE